MCCTNPDNVNCFGTIFPNLNFFLPQSVPPARYILDPTNTDVTQLSNSDNSAVALSSRNSMMSIHQRSARTNERLSFSESCSRPLDWRIRQSHLTSTLFHSLVPWWRPRRIRPQITRLSQLENSAMDTWPIYKNYIIPDWFEKWRDTLLTNDLKRKKNTFQLIEYLLTTFIFSFLFNLYLLFQWKVSTLVA